MKSKNMYFLQIRSANTASLLHRRKPPNLEQYKYDVQKPRWIFWGVVQQYYGMIYHEGTEKI